MQATLAWSWQLLSPTQRQHLAALTVPASPFAAETAQALLGLDAVGAALCLDELVAQSLLGVRPQPGGDLRFAMLEPVREFAAASLSADALRDVRQRHRAAWLARALALPVTVPLAELRADWPDLVRAVQSALDDGEPDAALHLLVALRWAIETLRLPAPAMRAVEQALCACADDALAAEAHAVFAPLALVAGRAAEGLRHTEAALRRAPAQRLDVRAEALINNARLRWTLDQIDPGIDLALDEVDALLASAPAGDQTLAALRARSSSIRGLIISSRADVASRAADGARAEALHRQALAAWQAMGNQHMAAKVAFDLGLAAYYGRRHAEVVQRMTPVIAHARANGMQARLSQACQVQGDAQGSLRHWRQAAQTLRECILVAWDAHGPLEMAFGLWTLPRILLRLGQVQAGLQLMAFAAAFWGQRIGPVTPALQRHFDKVQRQAALSLSLPQRDQALAEGAALTPAAAVALLEACVPVGAVAD